MFDTINPQELVDNYSTTGDLKLDRNNNWTNKEFCIAEFPIGFVVEEKTKDEISTCKFSISYSEKKGTHIVPRKE